MAEVKMQIGGLPPRLAILTGRHRYRPGGWFGRKLVLQVEEAVTQADIDGERQTRFLWRDATLADLTADIATAYHAGTR